MLTSEEMKKYGMTVIGDDPLGRPVEPFPEDIDNDGILSTFAKSIVYGFHTLAIGAVGTAEEVFEHIIPITEEGGWIEQARNNIVNSRRGFEVSPDNAAEWAGAVVGQALPYIGAAFAGQLYAGTLGSMAVGFATEGQEAYDRAIARGSSESSANLERGIVGVVNAAIEGLQMGKLMKFTKGSKITLKVIRDSISRKAYDKALAAGGKLTAGILRNALSEGFEEALQEGVQFTVPYLMEGADSLPLKEDGSVDKFAILEQVSAAALAGAVASPFLGLAKAGLGAASMPSDRAINTVRERILKGKISAEEKAASLDFLKTIEGTKLSKVTAKELKELIPEDEQVAIIEESKIDKRLRETAVKDEEGNPRMVFHGTTEEFTEYDPSEGGMYGPGIYLTENPEVASGYATEGIGANVRPSFVNIKNPFDVESTVVSKKDALRAIKNALIDTPGINTSKVKISSDKITYDVLTAAINGASVGKPNIAGLVNKVIRELGFDGITHMGGLRSGGEQHKVWIAFDNKQVIPAYSKMELSDPIKVIASSSRLQAININEHMRFLEKFNKNINTWNDAIKGKRKGYGTVKVPKLLDNFNQSDIDRVMKTISTVYAGNGRKITLANKAFIDLFMNGELPSAENLRLLDPILGFRNTNALRDLIHLSEKKDLKLRTKFLRSIGEALNIPKAVLSSVDFSASLRQGFFMLFTDPKSWAKGVSAGYKAFFSPEYAKFVDVIIKTDPQYTKAKRSGLEESEFGHVSKTEEYFASKWAGMIPGIKASERSFVTAMNMMRFQTFYNIAEDWAGTGQGSKENLNALAKIVNHLTGRGDVKTLKPFMPTLNITFFSPQLVISRFQTIGDLFKTETSVDGKTKWNPASKMLAWTLIKAFGTGALVLAALSRIKGVKVEYDPRSTDFGKVQIGDTRIDFWAGYSQIMRLIAGMATGERKTTGTGEIIQADRMQTVTRFLQTKLSPLAGLALDMNRGENFRGDELEGTPQAVIGQIYERFTPLFLQDMADAIRYQGLGTESLVTSTLALHGVNTMTYPESESTVLAKVKNHYAESVFETQWDNLGPIIQSMLKQRFPFITDQEKRVGEEMLHKPARARYIQDIRDSEREIISFFSESDQLELQKLLVDVGGVTRKINGDWYLNINRYKRYKTDVADRLKEVIPSLLKLDLPPMFKRNYIETVIKMVKDQVRQELVWNANMEDLERL